MAKTEKQRERCIDYVELNVADIARSRAFYGKAFGWGFTDFGPAYCEFSDGRMKGGFNATETPRPGGGPLVILYSGDLEAARDSVEAAGGRIARPGGGPLVILYSGDLEAARDSVEAAGGRIARPIYAFPGGRRFHFTDPDGYELAVWSES